MVTRETRGGRSDWPFKLNLKFSTVASEAQGSESVAVAVAVGATGSASGSHGERGDYVNQCLNLEHAEGVFFLTHEVMYTQSQITRDGVG